MTEPGAASVRMINAYLAGSEDESISIKEGEIGSVSDAQLAKSEV